MIRKFLIILGFLFLIIAIAGGVYIVILSFKFAGGAWLVWWKYALVMLGLAVASAIIAIIGIFIIYLATNTREGLENDS